MKKSVVRAMIGNFASYLHHTVHEIRGINEELVERNNYLADTVEHINKLNIRLIAGTNEFLDLNRKTMDETKARYEELMSIVRHNIFTDEQKAKYDKEVEKIDNPPPTLEIVKPEDDDLV